MTPLDRRKMLVKMGIADPIPSVAQRRLWEFIDDRVPPDGEPDGEFTSHIQWLNKASSWIGWTGAKTFDAKGRPCRNGGDMQRAKDEDAFPVRWYLPHRFPAPAPMSEGLFNLLAHLARADERRLTEAALMTAFQRKTLRSIPLQYAREHGYIEQTEPGCWRLSPVGFDEVQAEARRRNSAASIR